MCTKPAFSSPPIPLPHVPSPSQTTEGLSVQPQASRHCHALRQNSDLQYCLLNLTILRSKYLERTWKNQTKPTNQPKCGLFSAWGLSVAALRSLLQADGAATTSVRQDFQRGASDSYGNHQWNFGFQRRVILLSPAFALFLTANTSCFWGFWITYFLSGQSISPLCCTVDLEKTSTFFFHFFSFFLRTSSALCHLGCVPITTYT